MASAKKATTKPEVKAAEAAVKTTAPKAEEKAAAKPVVKAEKTAALAAVAAAKEEPAKKEPAKRGPGKRGPAKKTAAKKPAGKKAALKTAVCLQFSGKSYSEEDLVKMARDVWKYDLKQKLGELTSIELYVKPEENKAYYVMNKDFAGSFYI